MFSWIVPVSRAARAALSAGLIAALAPAGCSSTDDNSSGSCDCPADGEFVASSTTGVTFAVAGAGCEGACRKQGTSGCLEFVVTATTSTTCTVSVGPPGAGGAEENVSFLSNECCRAVLPGTRTWTVP